MAVKCVGCSAEIALETVKFCPECGADQVTGRIGPESRKKAKDLIKEAVAEFLTEERTKKTKKGTGSLLEDILE